MADEQAPILDFDPDRSAIIEPGMMHPPHPDRPTRGVITWMKDAFELFEANNAPIQRGQFAIESSTTPIYEFEVEGERVFVTMATVGAPASVALLEALVAGGCRQIIAVGSSGGLVPELAPGSIVVPDGAIRDEGVSYHYAPAELLAHHDPRVQDIVTRTFSEAGHTVTRGVVWTTDAFYRETEAKVATRVGQGAIAVDMEAASLAAAAKFRGIELGHAVYVADTLYGEAWDSTELRNTDTDFRYELLLTAASACAAA